MELRRDWWWGEGNHAFDHPPKERYCGSSLKWLCTVCGEGYAVMRAMKDGRVQVYSFIGGLCGHCTDKSNRWILAGSLECLPLVGWLHIPKPVLDYQLSVELAFLNHPEHPHNKVYD